MHSVTVVLLAYGVQAHASHAQGSIDNKLLMDKLVSKFVDNLVELSIVAYRPEEKEAEDRRRNLADMLFDRARRASHHRAQLDLDDTSFGKPGHLAISPRVRQRPLPTPGAHRTLAILGRLPRQAAQGRRTQVSTYAIVDMETLAALPAALPSKLDTVTNALSVLRDAPQAFFDWYDDQALEFPLRTKACTSGFCYGLGDISAQLRVGKNLTTLDFVRSARSGAAGFVGHGPVAHYWIAFLEKYFSFGGAWYAVPAKVVANQPMNLLYNTIYSFVTGTLALRDPKEIWRDTKAAAVPGFFASIKFWPFVNLITFGVIPIELRVAWVDTVKVVWITILSGINNEEVRGNLTTPAPSLAASSSGSGDRVLAADLNNSVSAV